MNDDACVLNTPGKSPARAEQLLQTAGTEQLLHTLLPQQLLLCITHTVSAPCMVHVSLQEQGNWRVHLCIRAKGQLVSQLLSPTEEQPLSLPAQPPTQTCTVPHCKYMSTL